jgi:hypothetical protein
MIYGSETKTGRWKELVRKQKERGLSKIKTVLLASDWLSHRMLGISWARHAAYPDSLYTTTLISSQSTQRMYAARTGNASLGPRTTDPNHLPCFCTSDITA